MSLQPGSHEEYGRCSFTKVDIISVDISWKEPGNIYFAIGREFGSFRGLASLGRDAASFPQKEQYCIIQMTGQGENPAFYFRAGGFFRLAYNTFV